MFTCVLASVGVGLPISYGFLDGFNDGSDLLVKDGFAALEDAGCNCVSNPGIALLVENSKKVIVWQ